jgi:hypothetical protein
VEFRQRDEHMSEKESTLEPIQQSLGTKTFLTWNPPTSPVKIGNITVSEGAGVCIAHQTTNSSGRSFWPTIKLDYEKLEQDELSRWVLFHTFITDNPWTLPSYMGTIQGVISWLDQPFGQLRDYSNFVNVAYRYEREKVKLTEVMSYGELFDRYQSINETQAGMVKNLLLKLTPGQSWSHGEMADYSYWRMVIDFSIIDAIIGQQPYCSQNHQCTACSKSGIAHYPVGAKDFAVSRLMEIIGDTEIVEQYMKIIWTVRQNIRHKTAHNSAYPGERPFSELQRGDNELAIDTIIETFEKDGHALTALEQNMHEATRVLLLNNVLNTKIFPGIRPYLIRSGGMSWEEFQELLNEASKG